MWDKETPERRARPGIEEMRTTVAESRSFNELEDAIDNLGKIDINVDGEKLIYSPDKIISDVRAVVRGERKITVLAKFGLEEKVQELLAASGGSDGEPRINPEAVPETVEIEKEKTQPPVARSEAPQQSPEERLAQVFKHCATEADTVLRLGFSGIGSVVRDREDQRMAPLFMDGIGGRLRGIAGLISEGWGKKNPMDIARGLRALANTLREPPQRQQMNREDRDSVRSAMTALRNLNEYLTEFEAKLKKFQNAPGVEVVIQELGAAKLACEQRYYAVEGYSRRVDRYSN